MYNNNFAKYLNNLTNFELLSSQAQRHRKCTILFVNIISVGLSRVFKTSPLWEVILRIKVFFCGHCL